MAERIHRALAAVSVSFVLTTACSSATDEVAASPTDAPDGGPGPSDAPPIDDAYRPGPPLAGTTGDRCTRDEDCKGAGIGARCSSTLAPSGAGSPSPVCLVVSPIGSSVCAVGNGTDVPLCDGERGLCVRNDDGANDCLPACRFSREGKPIRACAGDNACHVQWVDKAGTLHGFCWGGCVTDAECPVGNGCDLVTGLCMKRCKADADCGSAALRCDPAQNTCVAAFTSKVGDPCTKSDACSCLLGKGGVGACISACRTGATSGCGAGFACDPLLGSPGGPVAPGLALPDGLAGACLRGCTLDDDCPGGVCKRSPGMAVSTCRPRS